LDGLLDLGGDPLQFGDFYLSLVKRTNHGIEDLIAVEALAGTVPLDYDNGQALYDLIGGKPALASQTFPAAADAFTVFRTAGIHNFAFLISAERTFHGETLPCNIM
jgi:hypothetical protein